MMLPYFKYSGSLVKLDKMETIQVTQEEIRMATRPNVYRNRKKYTRKEKHKGKNE